MRAAMASLVVAFVVLSALANSGATSHGVITGTVVEFDKGESISVTNDQTDPWGNRFALGKATSYEAHDPTSIGDAAALRPGVRVTVWYRTNAANGGVGRSVADKVTVLANATTP